MLFLGVRNKTVKLLIVGVSVLLIVYNLTCIISWWWNSGSKRVHGEHNTLRQVQPPGVIVESTGPFGDQLFKYAVSFNIAKSLNIPLYLVEGNHSEEIGNEILVNGKDSVEYKSALQLFNLPLGEWINLESITKQNIWEIECSDVISGMTDDDTNTIQAHMGSEFISISQICESEEYFENVVEEIKLDLYPRVPWSSKAYVAWKDNIEEVNKIDVRADKTVGPRTSVAVLIDTTYRVLPINYYRQGMHLMEQKFRGSKEVIFFVFSNDMDYVKGNLVPAAGQEDESLPEELQFKQHNVFLVSGSEVEKSSPSLFEEFLLATLCRNIIISDSSEDWWAAYLSIKNYNKTVVVPKQVSHVEHEEPDDDNTVVSVRKHPKEWIELDLIY